MTYMQRKNEAMKCPIGTVWINRLNAREASLESREYPKSMMVRIVYSDTGRNQSMALSNLAQRFFPKLNETTPGTTAAEE